MEQAGGRRGRGEGLLGGVWRLRLRQWERQRSPLWHRAMSSTLCALNVLDVALAAAVAVGTAYELWLGHAHAHAPPLLWVPVLTVAAAIALSSLLNWLTLQCRGSTSSCAWLLSFSIIVDLLVATAAAVVGVLLCVDFGLVDGWVRSIEVDGNGSITGEGAPQGGRQPRRASSPPAALPANPRLLGAAL